MVANVNHVKDDNTLSINTKDNIAYDASVSIGTQPANQTIDGDKTSCSKTQGPNVMFQLDLKEMRIATDIYLTGKVNTTIPGLNHTIYTSNSSGSLEQGTVLYQVDSLTQHISIKAVFRYLTLVPAINSSFIGLEICEIGIVEKSELQEESNGAMIGGSLGAVIAIILIILAIIFIYKRNQKSTKHKYEDKSKPSRQITLNGKRETSHGNEYINTAITSDLGEVSLYLKDTEETIYSETDDVVYKNLPTERSVYKIPIRNLKEVISEKLKMMVSKKNMRFYRKVLSMHTLKAQKKKIKLKIVSLQLGHMIIHNYDKEKAYIAAQGPKKSTVRDFWHMLWQENVGKVVMVTQLIEGKRDKCIQYWPDAVNEPMEVDNYRLTMTKVKEHTLYVYRLIIFNNMNANQKDRKVHQFHFTQWPDHGVPDSTKLVYFYRKVKSQHCNQNGPMVVHCSAGVGRTGTFIAIDALYQHGNKVGYVDIMEYVQMMRKDRMNMIQTHEQYETVFEALLELFTIPDTSIPKNEFCKYIADQECKTLPKNQKVYKREFQGYREESKFFVTQCPMKGTVVDFWTLIYDHNSRIIVLLDQVNKNANLWLGKSEMLVVDDFSIMQEEENNVDELQIALEYKKQQDKRIINVFTASDWQGAALPSTKLMVDLLKSVVSCWNSQKCPITVVCRDGCTKSGLFVALYLIFDKMKIDEEIDIFQLVRNIQTRRPEFLKNCVSIWSTMYNTTLNVPTVAL
ncbi:Receptor-type tyrosine-protein phosphatase zeta,Tyrosine-protein phosphatase non-receptor type 7,Receptor-type tyrosine-protein phosphatase eta,Receptor-type tyrosine-protein phosphatase R,Tyrosine-protein phosphatase non-receptor type 5,Receptor-type tyrosine-protein phosphatase S,Receptor-type tyrosine-protein phosphatase beta,Receptor-type tyrosine-protein phosphatase O,Receptor-type tyrosine-protein phosphatase kappa,Receptor-type tyrosine-protein phosphatase delta,Receptor-type tyrosine-protein phosph|uniref:Uncharacterized protein n=1 Tax=Mytilus edulis TaxID=6550 RepID=A0A8S3Q021_MYTED|nr:Receptor-type tyrosine-protein phosphatase zeta,Tyrosine-protein phosphatase non-receptor type 7,Receptor-type tyrosine-protein phosphatase eta,Receptor-type tyrosine-protein phosphatase R,Tyrosine-protein phosphatase non-receptor type 5,Receptor-type tyrosine-protein phosphatase S,Receptor-type tyrosine-protein phosphatase beta,Receptor-type tyrosine-protein phosphatase O,Receptor-type tyrosine-protein phosphatase kappa,Receptor-type tyrosine-protein phosphatase delta,Receptor-type tyrosine-pro